MIARHRGDHSLHSRWRPQQPPAQHTDVDTVNQQPVLENSELHHPVLDPSPPRRSRRWPTAAVVLLLALGAVAITTNSGSHPSPTSTPTGWIDTYMAWSLRSPERACTQLLTPALRRLLADGNGGSCSRAYANIRNTPFRILRILQDASTAAVELHWLPNVGYSTILLNQRGGVWQAVDMIPGGQVIPRRHAHRTELLALTSAPASSAPELVTTLQPSPRRRKQGSIESRCRGTEIRACGGIVGHVNNRGTLPHRLRER